jgi:hypothetical protein
MSVVGLWSGKNYLKYAVSNPDTMSKPGTTDGLLGYFSTKTILHNLGYRPLVRVHYDPNSNGGIFPANGQGRQDTTNTSPLASVVPFWLYVDDVDTTTITLRTYSSSPLAGTFTFYYRIYIDPTL